MHYKMFTFIENLNILFTNYIWNQSVSDQLEQGMTGNHAEIQILL